MSTDAGGDLGGTRIIPSARFLDSGPLRTGAWLGFGVLAWYALFRLPYHFPPQQLVASNSINMGFNNAVASLAALGLVVLATILRAASRWPIADMLNILAGRNGEQASTRPPALGVRPFLLVLAVYLGAGCFLYATLPNLEGYGEAGYFLHRISLLLQYHLVPYRGMEFGYGPALIYLPAWLARLGRGMGVPIQASYLACYSLLCGAGLGLLYQLVNSMQIPLKDRRRTFYLMALLLFGISMGLQYLMIRYLLPYSLYLALHTTLPDLLRTEGWRARVQAWCLCFLAAMVSLTFSPETGLVFIVCLSSGFVLQMSTGGSGQFPCVLATLAALPASLLLLSPNFFNTVFMFARGGGNFPLVPSPFTLLFLSLTLFVLPLAFHEVLRFRHDARSPLLLTMALHPLLTLPAALGRSDAGHLVLNGVGVFLLVIPLLARRSRPVKWIVLALIVVVFGIAAQACSFWLYSGYLQPVVDTLSGNPRPAEEQPAGDPLQLATLSRIATPLGSDRATEHLLRSRQLYLPQYFPDSFNVATEADVLRQIRDLQDAHYLLIPAEYLQFHSSAEIDHLWAVPGFRRQLETQQENLMRRALLYPIDYKLVKKPYLPDLELAKYILNNYQLIRLGGGYALMAPRAGINSFAP